MQYEQPVSIISRCPNHPQNRCMYKQHEVLHEVSCIKCTHCHVVFFCIRIIVSWEFMSFFAHIRHDYFFGTKAVWQYVYPSTSELILKNTGKIDQYITKKKHDRANRLNNSWDVLSDIFLPLSHSTYQWLSDNSIANALNHSYHI